MHLQFSPDAPLALRATAEAALVLHIGGGAVGLGAGAVAMAARKGGRIHRLAGKVFLASMLVAMTIGAVVSPMIGQPANGIGGVLAIYLLLTAWITIRRPAGRVGRAEWLLLLAPMAAVVVDLAFGWIASHRPRGVLDGVPYQAGYALAAVSALALALDLKVILRGGVSGAQRLARHLWRMSVALFFASASLFIGQPQVFPPSLRGSPLLIALGVAPLVAMIYWLVRVRRLRPNNPLKASRNAASPAGQEAMS
jgi:uncharacterized membrane protein